MEVAEYDDGDDIVTAGDSADAMYLVVSGSAVLVQANNPGLELVLPPVCQVYGDGAFFGDRELLSGDTRGATVRAAEETVCLRLAREPFLEMSAKWGDIMDFLRKVPLLREVMQHDGDFETVASLLTVAEFEVGEAIVREGDAADALYLLQDGHAQAERADGAVLCAYKEGDYFGELALLSKTDDCRRATVRCVSADAGERRGDGPSAVCLKLERGPFQAVMEGFSGNLRAALERQYDQVLGDGACKLDRTATFGSSSEEDGSDHGGSDSDVSVRTASEALAARAQEWLARADEVEPASRCTAGHQG